MRLPFFGSAILSACLTLGALLARDGPGVQTSSPASASGGAAYIDYRQDVAHGGNVAGRAAASAFQWLRRHQHAEGLWSARSYSQLCEGKVCVGRGGDEHDVGVTALAALAMLESGLPRTEIERPARHALAWLAWQQDGSGCVGPRAGKYMYGQALATLAFVRGHLLLGETAYRSHAAAGVHFLEIARNPGLTWRYGVRDGENDTSVTAWVGAALLAASSIGIPVDSHAFEGIRRWLAGVTGEHDYETSYMRRGGGNAAVRGANDAYDRNEGLTAAALWLNLSLPGSDRRVHEVGGAAQARRLGWNLPVWNETATSVDYTSWFSGTRALAAYGDRELWDVWSGRVLRLLVNHQRRFNEGCLAGSWDPLDKWGGEGGRVYATAMNLLTLGIMNRLQGSTIPVTYR